MYKTETISKDYENLVKRLEARIEDLERKLEDSVTREEVEKEITSRLSAYGDVIRSDKGEIVLRKVFTMKDRAGRAEGRSFEENDHTALLYFTDDNKDNINHIFIGSASREGFANTSAVGVGVSYKKDAPQIINNGVFQVHLSREEDDVTDEKGAKYRVGVPQFQIVSSSIVQGKKEGEDFGRGEAIIITGTNKEGMVQISHFDEDGYSAAIGISKGEIYLHAPKIAINKALLPKSKPVEQGLVYLDGTTLRLS